MNNRVLPVIEDASYSEDVARTGLLVQRHDSGDMQASSSSKGLLSKLSTSLHRVLERSDSEASHGGDVTPRVHTGFERQPSSPPPMFRAMQGGDLALRVKSVTQLRKSSMAHTNSGRGQSNDMGIKVGLVAASFYTSHPKPGSGLCLSPAGDMLLSFGNSPEVRILKCQDGSLCGTLRGSPGNVRFAAFSEDGRHIISATDDCRILVYETLAAVERKVTVPRSDIDAGLEPVLYCRMSPDGKVVLTCDDEGQLETWSVDEEHMIKRYETGHASALAAFSSGGQAIVSCADFECGLVVVSTATAAVLHSESFEAISEGRNKPAYAISPDGSKVVMYIKETTFGDNLAVYSVESSSYSRLYVCDGSVVHVEFSSDGKEFVVAGRDNLISVYDSGTMQLVGMLEGHGADVMYCRVSGQYGISGDTDGDVIVWDVDESRPVLRMQAHSSPVMACDLSPCGNRAYTLDASGVALLWFLDKHAVFDILQQHPELLSCTQLTPDESKLAVGYTDGTLRLWSMASCSQAWSHQHHGSPVECLAVSPSGLMVASRATATS